MTVPTLVRKGIRTADYLYGVCFCGIALTGGSAASNWAQTLAISKCIHSKVAILIAIHLASFFYAQVVTRTAVAALNVAVRKDWHVERRGQFLLAAGPLFLALPLAIAMPAIGTAAGLATHLAALRMGYVRTDSPPAGIWATLIQLRKARRPQK